MENEQNRNPGNDQQSDISKAQSAQQPSEQASQQQAETSQQAGQPEKEQAKPAGSPDEGSRAIPATQQRTDVEGASLGSEDRGEAESGFVGSQAGQDSSSELVEDDKIPKGDPGRPTANKV